MYRLLVLPACLSTFLEGIYRPICVQKVLFWCQRMEFTLLIVALMVSVPLAFGLWLLMSWHRLLVVCILPISVNPESAESLATRPGRVTTPTTSEYELPDLDVIPSKVVQAYQLPTAIIFELWITRTEYRDRPALHRTCPPPSRSTITRSRATPHRSKPTSRQLSGTVTMRSVPSSSRVSPADEPSYRAHSSNDAKETNHALDL
jgi:hypothetical protein